jgi:RNA polymerase sigma-32 factor
MRLTTMSPPRTKKKAKAIEPEVLPPEEEQVEEELDAATQEDEEPSDEDLQETLPASRAAALLEDDKLPAAVSPSDPLRRYMEEVKQYPLLSPEEEFKLAMQLRETGAIEAAKKLVQANLRLVVKIAFEYRSIYSNIMDLVQEGNIGLMKAVSKYDPTKGARLGYYSSWWIRSYILKYLLDNFRLIRLGTTQAQKKLFYHLMREKEKLEAQGILAGPKLLAEKLNVREKDVVEMSQRLSGAGAEMSLDAPIGNEDEGGTRSHLDTMADPREGADETIAREEWIELLKDRIPAFRERLNEKERRLLDERLLAEEPKTLQEIADNYGLTRERARQIEAKVLDKLREFLKDEMRE